MTYTTLYKTATAANTGRLQASARPCCPPAGQHAAAPPQGAPQPAPAAAAQPGAGADRPRPRPLRPLQVSCGFLGVYIAGFRDVRISVLFMDFRLIYTAGNPLKPTLLKSDPDISVHKLIQNAKQKSLVRAAGAAGGCSGRAGVRGGGCLGRHGTLSEKALKQLFKKSGLAGVCVGGVWAGTQHPAHLFSRLSCSACVPLYALQYTQGRP